MSILALSLVAQWVAAGVAEPSPNAGGNWDSVHVRDYNVPQTYYGDDRFPGVATDSRGGLWAVYTGTKGDCSVDSVFVLYSPDHGASWTLKYALYDTTGLHVVGSDVSASVLTDRVYISYIATSETACSDRPPGEVRVFSFRHAGTGFTADEREVTASVFDNYTAAGVATDGYDPSVCFVAGFYESGQGAILDLYRTDDGGAGFTLVDSRPLGKAHLYSLGMSPDYDGGGAVLALADVEDDGFSSGYGVYYSRLTGADNNLDLELVALEQYRVGVLSVVSAPQGKLLAYELDVGSGRKLVTLAFDGAKWVRKLLDLPYSDIRSPCLSWMPLGYLALSFSAGAGTGWGRPYLLVNDMPLVRPWMNFAWWTVYPADSAATAQYRIRHRAGVYERLLSSAFWTDVGNGPVLLWASSLGVTGLNDVWGSYYNAPTVIGAEETQPGGSTGLKVSGGVGSAALFTLSGRGQATLSLYDAAGRLAGVPFSGTLSGRAEASFTGAPGVYLYRFGLEGAVQSGKFVIR